MIGKAEAAWKDKEVKSAGMERDDSGRQV